METFYAILSRRSIRKYKTDKVPEEMINKILEAGMCAPSAGNEQPWEFIIITERNILDDIPTFSPYANMAKSAPLGILVCGDLNREKYKGFWVEDCSACTENMLLTITDLGLGAVWTGVYPMADRVEGFKKKFNLPENIMPLAFVVIGYPDEEAKTADRFDKTRIHYNKW